MKRRTATETQAREQAIRRNWMLYRLEGMVANLQQIQDELMVGEARVGEAGVLLEVIRGDVQRILTLLRN